MSPLITRFLGRFDVDHLLQAPAFFGAYKFLDVIRAESS
jgi:hypothetical protein